MTGLAGTVAAQPGAAGDARPVLVGYSGGLDSTVLLHLLAGDTGARARGLRAIHVHHGLQADADAWARHCEAACASLAVPLEIRRVAVRRDSGEGLEAAARAARHAAFADSLREDEVLALAHHLDDQAETFLLRALRASGSNGLGAMRPWRRHARGWLWRPLLDTPRSELLAWARARALSWIEDPSNADDLHDRNFLRLRVMPLLRARWPQADAALAGSARLLRADAELLDAGDAQALAALRTPDPACLDALKLQALPPPRRARVLRRWIGGLGLPPLPGSGPAAIAAQLLPAARDSAASFRWRGAVIRRWRDLLHAQSDRPPLARDFRVEWDAASPLRLPTGDTLALLPGADGPSPPAGPWLVHARRGGERIVLPGRGHSHALKHVLQDLGVPPWVRERLPLLSAADGTLLAAGDLVLSAAFEAWSRGAGRRLRWATDPT